jgi:hypothetical protein
MNTILKLCAIAVASAIAITPTTLVAGEHVSPPKGERRLDLNQGQRWATDDSVRRNMESIRDQVRAMQESARHTRIQPEWYAALGASIEREIAEITRNCKLPPDADRNFHVILLQLAIASDTLQGRNSAAPDTGLRHAELVLMQYPRFFDHPGWLAKEPLDAATAESSLHRGFMALLK